MAWYHCGRCGQLFRSPASDVVDRRCAKCGRVPVLGLEAVPARSEPQPPAAAPAGTEIQQQRQKSQGRQPARSFLMTKILIGWLVVMGLIVFAVRHFWEEQNGTGTSKPASVAAAKGTAADESVVRLSQALPLCFTTLSGFLNAGTPEERNQFVFNPVAIAGRMARFYDLNPLTRIDPNSLKNTTNAMLTLSGVQALESRWHASDGRTFDCVFVEQNGEWRLDWEHFARYGDYPWSLFLTGGGASELEFRLLVRERLVKERSESSHMSLVFYAPRFGYPEQVGSASPEFLVKRDSPEGKVLSEAFLQHEKGTPLFGSKLPYLEPPDMLRVRVVIRRLPGEAEASYKFELVKVIACHWLALTEAETAAPAPAPPPKDNPAPPPP